MKTLTTWIVSFFIFGYTVVCSNLPSPKNVTLHTLNTNYVLKWDWDEAAGNTSSTTFTVQYLPTFKIKRPKRKQDWKLACGVTFQHFCNFSAMQLHYYGMWLLRVRAESGEQVSRWIQVEFCPDRDARLGPPSRVDVTLVNGHLQVLITDPVINTNGSMRELVPNLSYRTQYWKQDSQMQKLRNLLHQSNLIIIPNLDSWTWYCIRVQSFETFYNKTSVFSPTYCIQTNGHVSSWQIFLYFLSAMVLSFLLMFVLCYGFVKLYKVLKNTLYPNVSLPAHIHQPLCNSPGSDMPPLLTTEFEAEHCCDKLDVVSITAVVLEIPTSPEDSGLGSELGNRPHRRHSSGDSGVYSTAEDSGAGRPAARDGVQEVRLDTIGRRNLPKEPRDKEQEVCV